MTGHVQEGCAESNSFAFRYSENAVVIRNHHRNNQNKRSGNGDQPRVIYRDHEVEIAKSLMPSWKNPAMFKTHLCQFFTKHGYCRHEEFCWYAHSEEELRPLPKHGKPVAPILPEILGPLPNGITNPIELDNFKTPSQGESAAPVDLSVPFAPTQKPAHFALPIIPIKVPSAPIRIVVSSPSAFSNVDATPSPSTSSSTSS
ncbi:hypothetical protein L596_007428 [Steinernema carpocapsae]|uniref:C3H1-type domain-containing protein n=1 Tax=Steinernema carpocapsae TaxID=34508 RepID=A0A4U5P991_STECR|nr:hypothetical protein L596_007428 [Steinernema carpocapsae]